MELQSVQNIYWYGTVFPCLGVLEHWIPTQFGTQMYIQVLCEGKSLVTASLRAQGIPPNEPVKAEFLAPARSKGLDNLIRYHIRVLQ